jgi:uncharacterized protein YejL (UPF0352 family)/phosphoglycerate dehydrogenase-like enzyme
MKFIICCLSLLLITSSFASFTSDRDTLQQLFNGWFEAGKMSDPTTVVQCFDDNSATLTVKAIGDILHQLAKNNFQQAQKIATDFGNALPQSVKDCLGNNAEINHALEVYHIAGLTPDQIQQKVQKYVVGHILTIHKELTDLDNNFQSGKYVVVGQHAGALTQEVFGKVIVLQSDRDTLQQLFNGWFEAGKMSDPTTVVQCFDDSSASLTVNAVGNILHQLAINNFQQAQKIANDFGNALPQSVKDCLGNNAEINHALDVYHITGLTPDQIQSKIQKYVVSHILTIHKELVDLDNNFQSGKYVVVGQHAGALTQDVFGKVSSLRSDRDTLQQLFNGWFEAGKMSDPTTVVQCFDDSSATLTVNAVGSILHQLAINNFQQAQKIADDFGNNLPQSVKDCLGNNAEINHALDVYHITGLTPDQIQSKIQKYVVSHILTIHKELVDLDNNFQSGKYNVVGQHAGALTQDVFGKVRRFRLRSDRDTLQQLFNGWFEAGKMSDPTTVVQCFDDSSATLTVKAIGDILHQLAKNNFQQAQKIATDFGNALPQSVKDCLNNNAEINHALQVYHIAGLTPDQIQQKVQKYVVGHILTIHKELVDLDNNFQSGKYVVVGQHAGALTQEVFGKVRGLQSDRDTLQQLFNGWFEAGKMSDPTTVVQCFDDSSATLTVKAIGDILHQLAKNNFQQAQKIATDFGNALPQSVKDCLNNNAEINHALQVYHIAGLTPDQIQQKVQKYVVGHILTIHKELTDLDNNFQSGKYVVVGQHAGALTQEVFGKVRGLQGDRDTLQLLYNGLFEEGGLLDPVSVLSCYDDKSASLTVSSLGTLLVQLAANNYIAAQQTIKTYQASIPQSVNDCLGNNGEITGLLIKYNIAGLTYDQVQAKVQKYVVTHLIPLHKDILQANTDFQGSRFPQVGQKAGQIAQQIFGTSRRFRVSQF